MGYWRDLVYEDTISTDHTYFSLPAEAESLLSATVDDIHMGARTVWSDYRVNGSGSVSGPDPIYGIVDDGYAPTIIDLVETRKYQMVVIPNGAESVLPSSGTVTIVFLDYDGIKRTEVLTLDGSAKVASAYRNTSKIISITFDEVHTEVLVSAQIQGALPDTGGNLEKFQLTVEPTTGDTQASGLIAYGASYTTITTELDAAYAGTSTGSAETVFVEGVTDTTREAFTSYSILHLEAPPRSREEITGADILSDPEVEIYTTTVINNVDGFYPAELQHIFINKIVELVVARGVGSKVFRYRRMRLFNSDSSTKVVNLLLKRSFTPLINYSDIIYLGNLNAIKHGLLGTIAEDNGDMDRAQYHWAVCRQLLEEEMDAHRGSIRPTVKFDPSGGAGPTVRNLM